jgi:hypothetical protein
MRRELFAFWQEVSDYNDAHPIAPERRLDVCFYFGQGVYGGDELPNDVAADAQDPSSTDGPK